MKKHPFDRASVLVFAVLLLAAGVFVLTGIAQIGATQAIVGQDEWALLERRNTLENSRAMARQFMLARMFYQPVTDNVSFTAGDGMGGFTLEPVEGVTAAGGDYWTTFSTTNTNINLNINPFTLMERGGFYRVVVPGSISDGAESVPWSFQVRTRSPVTAGFSFVQHVKKGSPAVNSGLLQSLDPPYVDMRNPEQFVGFHEMARMRVSSITNTNASDAGYDGTIDKLTNLASPVPFTAVNFVPGDANGTNWTVEVDLSDDSSGEVGAAFTYEVPATFQPPGDPAPLPVTGVRLLGTDVYPLPPLQIVVPDTNENTRTLFLSGRNPQTYGRPVYVNIIGSPTREDTFTIDANDAEGDWRIGVSAAVLTNNVAGLNEFDVVTFAYPPGFRIFGGLRTDGLVSNPPPLLRDTDPGGMDYVADRMMWLEDYRTP